MKDDEQEFNLAEVISAIKRRSKLLILVGITVFLIGLSIAAFLPSVYRTQAVILIERQEIPVDLVRSTVTSFAEQRIQVLSQRVMSSSNLTRVIDQFSLYTDDKSNETSEDILDNMRSKIALEMISADVVDPKSGKPTEATIAFSLSFEDKTARKSQQVVNDLVTSFLNENIKSRTDSAAETTSFLDDEAQSLKVQVKDLESQIAKFKDENTGSRPELEGLTREMMNRTELHLTEVDRMIYEASRHEIFLEAELAQVKPIRLDADPRRSSVIEQFISLEAQLAAAEASYGESHPDVIRLRKQAEAMRSSVDPNAARDLFEDQLAVAQSTLNEMLDRYGETHPDVEKARKARDNLARRMDALPQGVEENPSNPAYLALTARLNSSRGQQKSLEIKRAELLTKLDTYATSLMLMPDAEAKYRALNRDYETAVFKLREISAKQSEARLSQNLESERKGEKFTLIEPPLLPERPAKPNRPAIVIISVLLSAIFGFGAVSIAELIDDTVRGRSALQDVFSAPPLATIPLIEAQDLNATRKMYGRAAAGIIFLSLLATLAIHSFVMPVDVLLFSVLRKTGF
jgi:succinoglycan biosynthesis transport protein ExoP